MATMSATATEPVAVAVASATFVKAVLAAVVALGVWHLSGEQMAYVAVAVDAAVGIPAALWARRRVTPVTTSV